MTKRSSVVAICILAFVIIVISATTSVPASRIPQVPPRQLGAVILPSSSLLIAYVTDYPDYGTGIILLNSTGVLNFHSWSGEPLVGAAWTGETLYMIGASTTDSKIYSIDMRTLTPTLLGTVGWSLKAMTFDVESGQLYASGGSMAENLYLINQETYHASVIGEFGEGLLDMAMLACDHHGTMYGIEILTGSLYEIDQFEGTSTLIGPTFVAMDYGLDMAFDDEFLYVSVGGQSPALYMCDVANGQMGLVENLDSDMDAMDYMTFPDEPPATTIFLNGTLDDGVFVSPVIVTLTAVPGGAPVAYTSYQLDGGDLQEYTAPFIVSSPGEHFILFFSVDIAGFVESPKTVEFTIVHNIGVTINGGFGITAVLSNYCATTVDINWTLSLSGFVFPKEKSETENDVAAGSDVIVRIPVVGIGPTTITVTVNGVEKTARGFVFAFFILGVN
jgi:hypothetical protein